MRLLLLLLFLPMVAAGCASDGVPAGSLDAAPKDAAPDLEPDLLIGVNPIDPLPRTCDEARTELKEGCDFGELWISELSCARSPDCVLACFALVKRCDDVGCAFCGACDCVGPRTPFEKCVFACP